MFSMFSMFVIVSIVFGSRVLWSSAARSENYALSAQEKMCYNRKGHPLRRIRLQKAKIRIIQERLPRKARAGLWILPRK